LVARQYRFDQHQVEPTVTDVLTELVAHHDAADAVTDLEAAAAARWGWPDPQAVVATADQLHGNPVVGPLADPDGRAADLLAAIDRLLDATGPMLTGEATTVAELAALGRDLQATPAGLERAAIAWSRLDGRHDATVLAARSAPSLDSVELTLVARALEHRAIGSFPVQTGAEVDDLIARVGSAYDSLLEANADAVVAAARARFLDNVAHSEASMAGRSDDDKERKRAYNAGRRLLEKEFNKKMRYRSIRELATGDPGAVVRDLRPIWLMSPLSVSDTLPLDDDLFDVVIFDEASQIPVEDAVPTVARAPQVVVVGDRMQLPPTRFFATDDGEDAADAVDGHGNRLSITLDADSFLTQSDVGLPSAMLSWHYRSRSESLIAYSNNAFYQGNLATIPDRALPPGPRPAIAATDATDGAANLNATLERPISFHRIIDGVYQDRRNQPEADYIAEMIRAMLTDPEFDLTIGVVAFSEAQQRAIEGSLDELALLDTDFAAALTAEFERVDDDEFVGLFVKNLENVQGDERDIIIMSVCYGPGPNRAMRMNFGPINQAGGERRLNVIFSRAKQHMVVVSTIDGSAITNTHNTGAEHLASFLDYAAAESIGDTATASAILSRQRGQLTGGHQTGSDSPAAVAIADALRARGYEVDLSVGRSDFHIDLAVRGEGRYALGLIIEPDVGAPVGDHRDRYIAEAGVLDAFGWPIMRVLLSEWWTQPELVLSRIDDRLRLTSAPGLR
jgi:hypothetical protein